MTSKLDTTDHGAYLQGDPNIEATSRPYRRSPKPLLPEGVPEASLYADCRAIIRRSHYLSMTFTLD
jgi:hypothetical protein